MGTFSLEFPWWVVIIGMLALLTPLILAGVSYMFWRKYHKKNKKLEVVFLCLMGFFLIMQVLFILDNFLFNWIKSNINR